MQSLHSIDKETNGLAFLTEAERDIITQIIQLDDRYKFKIFPNRKNERRIQYTMRGETYLDLLPSDYTYFYSIKPLRFNVELVLRHVEAIIYE